MNEYKNTFSSLPADRLANEIPALSAILGDVFSVFEKKPPLHVALLLIVYFEANNNFFRYTIGRWNGHCFISENCEVLNVGWYAVLKNCPQMEEKKYREENIRSIKDHIFRHISQYKEFCEEIAVNSVGELDLSRYTDEKSRIEMYLDHEFRPLS